MKITKNTFRIFSAQWHDARDFSIKCDPGQWTVQGATIAPPELVACIIADEGLFLKIIIAIRLSNFNSKIFFQLALLTSANWNAPRMMIADR